MAPQNMNHKHTDTNSLVIELDTVQGLVVKIKPHEVYCEQVGEASKLEALMSITESITPCTLVLVVA